MLNQIRYLQACDLDILYSYYKWLDNNFGAFEKGLDENEKYDFLLSSLAESGKKVNLRHKSCAHWLIVKIG